ncbi:AtpZ/AtpI family protein [Sulfitobacter aestuariivivens]|uniref:ATP synthase protein I n=1 Tax=Sulfitobacter aestuariivivens TaxID=2766981 RepID=A0A927HGV7_9RHOB|nr:AtpZ/AtpI family protein [Sulfitobacter aestuariivivens]
MTDPDQQQRLQQLEAKLDAAKKRNAPKPRVDKTVDQTHLAWRMVIELVVGLLIGFGIGWGLDWLLGTLPIFLMLFTLLGLAAGIKTMLRSATEMQNKQMADAAAQSAHVEGKTDEGA